MENLTKEQKQVLSDLNREKIQKQYSPKLWIDRLKFKKPLLILFFLLMAAEFLISVLFLGDFDLYMSAPFQNLLMYGVIFSCALYISATLPKKFFELIITNKIIFESDDDFFKFLNDTDHSFYKKLELIFPPLFGLGYLIGLLLVGYSNEGFKAVGWAGLSTRIPEQYVYLNILTYFITGTYIFFLFTISFSTIIVIFWIFKSLNKLGSEKYPLNVTYKDLKIGAFDRIGKFVISLTIPIIILCTILSILGLYRVIIQKAYLAGYIFMGLGLAITTLMAFLLYKNTLHIHDSITRFKFNLQENLLDKIQKINENDPSIGDMDIKSKYETIQNINNLYYEIDKINDWPFNPTSIRKLTITFGSSILPLIISFFGLG
ncbi:MAG: membrane protein of unknown function [Promethearchaeota archaeon]|nr:MAG: membrane protein of unknown function [Candidatus Lokiarchaeota archaeon]